jgi:hypothetical protein
MLSLNSRKLSDKAGSEHGSLSKIIIININEKKFGVKKILVFHVFDWGGIHVRREILHTPQTRTAKACPSTWKCERL